MTIAVLGLCIYTVVGLLSHLFSAWIGYLEDKFPAGDYFDGTVIFVLFFAVFCSLLWGLGHIAMYFVVNL